MGARETSSGGGTTLPVTDATEVVKGSGDATKKVRIEADGITTGTTRVWTAPDANTNIPVSAQTLTFTGPTAARTITLPDANFTAARTDAGQTFAPPQRIGTATTADALADTLLSTSATTQKGAVVQMKASQTANPFEIQNSDGTVAASFGVPGTNASSTIGTVTAPGLTLTSGVDTLKISADNQFHSSIVANWGLVVATTGTFSVGGQALGSALIDDGDANGINLTRRSIVFGRHGPQSGTGPVTIGPTTITIRRQVNSDQVSELRIIGNASDPDATSNLVGAAVAITGGDGAANSAGLASGGAVVLNGGTGFGTGVAGAVEIATTRGGVKFGRTVTAAGTTGNQTINKPAGTVNIAAAGTSVVVTNSLVTADSIIFVTVRTADATAQVTSVVAAAGSFTINTVAVTAETSFGFLVTN